MLSHVISTFRSGVMAGLVPAIHVFIVRQGGKDVDARDKRGHDAQAAYQWTKHRQNDGSIRSLFAGNRCQSVSLLRNPARAISLLLERKRQAVDSLAL